MGDYRFQPGEVVICIDDQRAPMLKKGHVYRIATRIAGYEGYSLDGVDVPAPYQGFWGSRFRKITGHWSRTGLVHRVPA